MSRKGGGKADDGRSHLGNRLRRKIAVKVREDRLVAGGGRMVGLVHNHTLERARIVLGQSLPQRLDRADRDIRLA